MPFEKAFRESSRGSITSGSPMHWRTPSRRSFHFSETRSSGIAALKGTPDYSIASKPVSVRSLTSREGSMAELTPMEAYARRVHRDAAVARTRSRVRRLAAPLFKKYLRVVPSVFTARGEFRAFRLLLPRAEALSRLRDRAVLTVDSA